MADFNDIELKCEGTLKVEVEQMQPLREQFDTWLYVKGLHADQNSINTPSQTNSNILKEILKSIDLSKQAPFDKVCFSKDSFDRGGGGGGGYDKGGFDKACFDKN